MPTLKIIYRKIAELKPSEYNPRKITDKEFKDLQTSFKNLGTLESAVINQYKGRENIIISGHQRLKVATSLNMDEYPCYEVKFPLKKEREANIRMNKNNGEWDYGLLESEFEIDDLKDWGFEDDELEFEHELKTGETDDDHVPDAPNEPITKLGDLYQLGEHRLLCGDSTNIQHVERLMDGNCQSVFTDPPYGINAVSKSGVLKEKYGTDILGDDSNEVAIDSFNLCKSLNIDKMVFWGANYYPECLPSSGCWIMWDKNNGGSDQADGELAWTNFDGVVRKFVKASEKTNRVHPTQKPCELIEWVFDRWEFGETVLDLFGGSGSTLIACEKTNRKARLMELDPKYCDVIVKRWEEYTGLKCELLTK